MACQRAYGACSVQGGTDGATVLGPPAPGCLADAGLNVYKQNLDISSQFYEDVISTQTYRDPLETVE